MAASLTNQVSKVVASSDEILSMAPVWPMAAHAISAIICMGCSALFHLMHVRCEQTNKWLARLDYGGITVLIFGAFVPFLWY
jgi:adiponectin receptor